MVNLSALVAVEYGVDLVGPAGALVEVSNLGHVQDDVVGVVEGVVLDHVCCFAFAQHTVL